MNDYELRWVQRSVPCPEFGPNMGRLEKVLQHRSEHLVDRVGNEGVWEWTEWEDVPSVGEVPSYPG